MRSEFPKSPTTFLTAKSFQDQKLTLTFLGWDKRSNDDRPAKGKMAATTWKQNLKYVLRYSYPEFAIDEAGERVLDDNGQPKKNSNFDPDFPRGYTIIYSFAEGNFESGSFPLWKSFCLVRPKAGETLLIGKTGKDKETVWEVKKLLPGQIHSASTDDVPEIDWSSPEYNGDIEPPPA